MHTQCEVFEEALKLAAHFFGLISLFESAQFKQAINLDLCSAFSMS